jgi:hypothetical protein
MHKLKNENRRKKIFNLSQKKLSASIVTAKVYDLLRVNEILNKISQ